MGIFQRQPDEEAYEEETDLEDARETPSGPSEGQQNRRKIISLALQTILLFMVAIVIVYVAISAIAGSSLFVPRSADEVLRSVQVPERYQWISESARRIELPGGQKEEQFAVRSVALSRERGIFLANLFGVLPDPAIYLSDRRATVRISEAETINAADARDGVLVTDACAAEGNPRTPTEDDDDPVSVSLLEMPGAEEILQSDPRLLDDKATFQGRRAWLIEFRPSQEVIEQLLWRPFLREALRGGEFAGERSWIESPEEVRALEEGRFRTRWAYAWVLRDSRELAQIRIRLDMPLLIEGEKVNISYHLLGHLFSSQALTQLDRQNIGGRFFCGD